MSVRPSPAPLSLAAGQRSHACGRASFSEPTGAGGGADCALLLALVSVPPEPVSTLALATAPPAPPGSAPSVPA